MKRIRVTVDFWLDVPSFPLDKLVVEPKIEMMHQDNDGEYHLILSKLVHFQTQEIVEEDG